MTDRNANGNEKELPQDAEALLRGLDALARDFEDPDKPFSEETKAVLDSIASMMDKAEEDFMNGTVVINPEVLSRFREGARLLKTVAEKGGRIVKIDLEPHIGPAFIRFAADSALILSGETLAAFADLVETADCVEIEAKLDGTVEFDFSFRHMWKNAEEE